MVKLYITIGVEINKKGWFITSFYFCDIYIIMKNIIKNLLKEEIKNKPTIGKNVFLIMHKSGQFVFTRFLTRGTYWVSLNDYLDVKSKSLGDITFKTEEEANSFLRLVIHCFKNQRSICGYKLELEQQRENFKPEEWEIVEYVMGLTPKQDVSNIFGGLNEDFNPEDLGWVEELAGELPNEIGEPRLTKDGMNLILTDGIVSMLTGLKKPDVKNKEQRTLRNYTVNNIIPYKKMRYKKDGLNMYSMDVSFKKTGDNQWTVNGRSGDFGWGDWFYSKKHIFGKRIRLQIFKQVLSDFKEAIMK